VLCYGRLPLLLRFHPLVDDVLVEADGVAVPHDAPDQLSGTKIRNTGSKLRVDRKNSEEKRKHRQEGEISMYQPKSIQI
jgi:hypothetical protein